MEYELELERIAKSINDSKAKSVLIQLPDGLKPQAKEILEYVKPRVDKDTRVLFWAGSCFGACDVPLEAERMGVDLVVQLGHSEWR